MAVKKQRWALSTLGRGKQREETHPSHVLLRFDRKKEGKAKKKSERNLALIN